MMRFASIGSGSQGNGLLIEATDGSTVTRLLIDCGFPIRRTVAQLEKLGIMPSSLSAILISHEHLDHVRGAPALAKKYEIPIWMSPGTHKAVRKKHSPGWVSVFDSHESFEVNGLSVTPIPVPHDAREPVQFLITDGNHKLINLTDLGSVTPHIMEMSTGCDAMVLECNHDLDMLKNGPYHAALKKRVGGYLGHLSNTAAAEFIKSIDHSRLQHLVAAHISQENNQPSLAKEALAAAVTASSADIEVATQDDGFGWREIQ